MKCQNPSIRPLTGFLHLNPIRTHHLSPLTIRERRQSILIILDIMLSSSCWHRASQRKSFHLFGRGARFANSKFNSSNSIEHGAQISTNSIEEKQKGTPPSEPSSRCKTYEQRVYHIIIPRSIAVSDTGNVRESTTMFHLSER